LDLCTDDVVFLPPNGPPLLGKEVIGQWLSSSGDQIQDIQISNLKIDGAESVSYLTANYATSYTISAAAATSKAQGVHLWILRKLNSGDWKVAVVMWSSFEE
jgi:ketosteroid isomerase-like protein